MKNRKALVSGHYSPGTSADYTRGSTPIDCIPKMQSSFLEHGSRMPFLFSCRLSPSLLAVSWKDTYCPVIAFIY